MIDFDNCSHRRWNPLTQRWVLCSPHRTKRPWLGQVEKGGEVERPKYDPACYLCPGNKRAGSECNPQYTDCYIFPNDFPAVEDIIAEKEGTDEEESAKSQFLFKSEPTRGKCQVICFSPRHDLTVAQMRTEEILPIIEAWSRIYAESIDIPYVDYCQIFENKGEIMGCSNPHPHGQVWSTEQVPEEPRLELEGMRKYRNESGDPSADLLLDYAKMELRKQARLVCENDSFICVVPWWAVWPFETMVLPKSQLLNSLLDFSPKQKVDLADILRRITCRYDNLFNCSFPYSMGLHQAPTIADRNSEDVKLFQFHIHFYPPLLRSATVKKFLVGFEMLGTPQRDLTSEQAAARLRSLSETHYRLQEQNF